MRRNARSCTRGRHAGSAASQVVAKKSGAVAPSKRLAEAAGSREFHEFPSTSRKSVHLHSSCFSSLGVFVANLFCSLGSFSSWARSQICANPKGSVFFRMVHARGAPQARGDAMRRRRAARNAISTTINWYFLLGRVVKCADAAHCDARMPKIALFSSACEPLFRYWACCVLVQEPTQFWWGGANGDLEFLDLIDNRRSLPI